MVFIIRLLRSIQYLVIDCCEERASPTFLVLVMLLLLCSKMFPSFELNNMLFSLFNSLVGLGADLFDINSNEQC